MYIFVLCLRNLIKLQGNVWAWLCTSSGGPSGSDDGWVARGSLVSPGPCAVLIKATASQASVPWKCPPLCSEGAPPPESTPAQCP